jgi:hypothetical protein
VTVTVESGFSGQTGRKIQRDSEWCGSGLSGAPATVWEALRLFLQELFLFLAEGVVALFCEQKTVGAGTAAVTRQGGLSAVRLDRGEGEIVFAEAFR